MKINQRKDGLYYKEKKYNGKRYVFTSTDKKEVEAKVIEFENNINRGAVINDKNIKFSDWCDTWLELYKKKNVEKSTYEMYKSVINNHLKPNLGFYKISEIRESHIMDMLNKMDEKWITRRKDIALLTVKQILEKAVDNDYVYKNVAKNIKIKKHIAKEKEPLPQNYIDLLQKYAKTDPRAFLGYFMVYTGVRKEELVPLTYEDIDFEKKTLRINKAVYFERNQPKLKKTKNGEIRYVPLVDNLFELLEHKQGILFPNIKGKMMSDTTTKRKIKYINDFIKEKIDEENSNKKEDETKEIFKPFTAHQLRHTYACLLHKAEIPLKEAQYFMGHKDVKMLLNIYTHLDDKDKETASNLLNNFSKI